ncbi:MAG: hypothetical protein EPN93_17255 [Spirochaetes bacterium]|nr:MAG: hypothetical protein EPN93_17255 [Spirochaetota bacterium]
MDDDFILDFEESMEDLLRSETMMEVPAEVVREKLAYIIEVGLPIRHKKKDGTFSFIPPKEFDSYLKNKEMVFYLDGDSFQRLKRAQIILEQPIVPVPIEVEGSLADVPVYRPPEPDKVFDTALKLAREMDLMERIQSLMNNNHRLKTLAEEGKRFDAGTMGETGNIFAQSMCVNKATLGENLDRTVPRAQLRKMVSESFLLIDNLINLMSKGKASHKDLAQLQNIQTNSVTLDHMNRILIRYISFLFFYNGYFQKYSNEVKRFRAEFGKRFHPLYDKIFRGSQRITLEIAYKGGIAPVRDRMAFIDYAMGGFMHDVGKLPEVDYHDGNEGYDPRRARRHVFESYNMLIESQEFSIGVVSTGLLHHDYYGAPYGYRQLATFRSRFVERRGEQRDTSPTKYCISYNINDVGFGSALSYFPNKILEIIDVYDAMTDPGKKYRKPMTPDEALATIRHDYIDGEYLGVDPILFNIFADFLNASGVVLDHAFIAGIKI